MDFKDAELLSDVIKAIAHPVRLMMVDYLKTGSKSFSDIFNLFDIDKSTVSKHLLVLKQAGIISSKKTGRDMIYTLETSCILKVPLCVFGVIKKNVSKQSRCLNNK